MNERPPRSTGEILSDALALLRRHLRLTFTLALPFCAVDLMLREAGQSMLSRFTSQFGQEPGSLDPDMILGAVAGGVAGLGLLLASMLVVSVLAVGIVALTSSAWHGRAPALGDALRAITSRAAPALLTMLLFFAALAGVVAAAGVLVAIATVVSTIIDSLVTAVLVGGAVSIFLLWAVVFLTLRWSVNLQAVVLEERSGPSALARSSELMAHHGAPLFHSAKMRLSLLFLCTFAISLTMQSLFIAPRLVLALASGWTIKDGLPPLASMPLWFIVPFGVLEVLTNALVVPFSAVLMTLFYFDLRVRNEGLDLAPSEPVP